MNLHERAAKALWNLNVTTVPFLVYTLIAWALLSVLFAHYMNIGYVAIGVAAMLLILLPIQEDFEPER